MQINTNQTIVINYEDCGSPCKVTISDNSENNKYVEIKQSGDIVLFPKELVDAVVRSLAKFSN